ncbi:type II toxin-antitoxin system HicA family toxin [Candidatus Poribacteria bacterium]|nr:type II toxin-antitoxin system HicA family toxin [Candidatus Poribacteria bacterium]
MPAFGPIKRRELVYYLRQVGFSGPYSGGKHQFMTQGQLRVRIPNPHKEDIGKNLLMRILREAGIDREEWEQL